MRIPLPRFLRPPAKREPAAVPPPSAPDAPPREVRERVLDSVSVTYMDSPVPEVDSAYGYGHLEGRRGVDPEHFRGFIHQTVQGEAIEQRLAELQADEQALRQRAAEVRHRRADLAAGAESLRALRDREERCTREADAAEEALERAEAAAREHERGSYSHALMFLVAGALFVFGDVVMTRKIVADALQLTGHRVLGLLDESWVFAAGLAMISIVLKPAYDRLVEKPYWSGKEKPFLAVICVLALSSLVTLWVLGEFRADAYASQQRLIMLQEDTGISETDRTRGIDALQTAMLDSRLATLSFVLSGILFATAGAVTLSIGTRYLRNALHDRRPARKRVRRSHKALKTARESRVAVVLELATRTERHEYLRALAEDDPPAMELDARAEAVAAQRRELAERFVSARQQRLHHLYDDGYALGGLLKLDADADERRSASASRPRRKRPRPFLALRRSIRERALTPDTIH